MVVAVAKEKAQKVAAVEMMVAAKVEAKVVIARRQRISRHQRNKHSTQQ